MKARKIVRGAAAGLLSISLLFSGLPVAAAESGYHTPLSVKKTERGSSKAAEQNPAGEQQSPGSSRTGEGGESQNPSGSQTGDANYTQNPAEGTESTQNPPGEQGSSDMSRTEGTGSTQNPSEGSGQTVNPSEEQGNPNSSQAEGTDNTQNPSDSQAGDGQNPSDSQVGDGQNPAEGSEQTENSDGSQTEDTKSPEGESENLDSQSDSKDGNTEDKNADEAGGQDAQSELKDENAEDKNVDEAGEDQLAASKAYHSVNGSISIDGSLSDWAGVAERSGSGMDYWKAAFSPDGGTLYLSFTGSASTEWDYGFTSNKFQFAYPDGASDISSGISVAASQGEAKVKNAYYGDVPGAEAAVINEAHGNNPGPYTVELAVPVSFFHSSEFTLTFGGTQVSSQEIEQVNGDSIEEDLPAVYNGISIDGKYADWKAVEKTDASCPNSAHTGCLSQAAAVFDGDWFYIYIKDGKGSNASGAGTHSNGKFAITSDLGYETDIQLTTTPEINGVNGAKVAYVGSEWEIAIPKDQLPKYRESLSFGFYLGEPLVGSIVNLQPDSGNNLENLFDGINFDGQYDDWEDYGHSTIQYATAGSQESQIDAKGALYSSDGKLYGHVVTTMPQHLQEAGQEFTEAITIAFNQSMDSLKSGSVDQSMVFYPRFVTVDANGTIDWNPRRAGLPEGTYEYHIVSRDAWGQSQNISNLQEMDQIYGKMIMTIGTNGKDEMEYYLELPMIAKKLGVDETSLKEIAAQYGRIGQEWIFTAGTSTGPVAGVAVCIATVGIVLWYKKKKKGELIPAAV